MNRIILSSSVMPTLCGCDHLAAAEPFYHADRVADFHVMIFVTEGCIYVTEDDTDYAVSAGELLFLKSGVRHYGKTQIPRGTKWYYAHFICPQTEQPQFIPDSAPIPQYTLLTSSLPLPKYITGLSGSDTERDIAELIRFYHSDAPLRGWTLNSMLFSLLSRLALAELPLPRSATLSDNICAYLHDHMTEPFSADSVSREFYLSYKHLAAVFKKEKGITMQQYHTSLRMSEARRLLRSTLLTIGEVASRVGYQDMLYFSRCFRNNTGYSPTEYRKQPQTY